MHFSEIIAAIALLFGAVIGLAALFAPDWAARTVRLVPDPAPAMSGGYSEFRATYGGLFLFSHLMTLVLVLNTPPILGRGGDAARHGLAGRGDRPGNVAGDGPREKSRNGADSDLDAHRTGDGRCYCAADPAIQDLIGRHRRGQRK